MTKQEVIDLIEKYQQGTASAKERGLLESWYHEYGKAFGQLSDFPDDVWARQDQSLQEILDSTQLKVKQKTIRLWPRIAVAAAAVTAITLGVWLYVNEIASSRNASRNDEVVSNVHDIKPGSVGATLTLANGKTIKLSSATNGELAKEAGVTITKSADGQLIYEIASSRNAPRNDGEGSLDHATSRDPSGVGMTNVLSTAKGETYVVRLPDGSKVWLNAASTLTYSSALGATGTRRVQLQGEAYFEIFKMTRPSVRGRTGASRSNLPERVPFIVESKNQVVEVLGTHFNINSYADEGSIRTTLLEGSVKVAFKTQTDVSTTGQKNGVTLRPGQQAIFTSWTNGAAQLQAIKVNAADAISWKAGYFVFKSTPLESVMKQVERWYNVDIVYADESLKSSTFSGSASRYENVSIILKTIENTGEVKFKIEGRKVIVTR